MHKNIPLIAEFKDEELSMAALALKDKEVINQKDLWEIASSSVCLKNLDRKKLFEDVFQNPDLTSPLDVYELRGDTVKRLEKELGWVGLEFPKFFRKLKVNDYCLTPMGDGRVIEIYEKEVLVHFGVYENKHRFLLEDVCSFSESGKKEALKKNRKVLNQIKRTSLNEFEENLASQVENLFNEHNNQLKKTEEEIGMQKTQRIIEGSLASIPVDVCKHYQAKLDRVKNAKSEGELDRFFKTLEGVLKEAIEIEEKYLQKKRKKTGNDAPVLQSFTYSDEIDDMLKDYGIEPEGKKANAKKTSAKKKFRPPAYLTEEEFYRRYSNPKGVLETRLIGGINVSGLVKSIKRNAETEFDKFKEMKIQEINEKSKNSRVNKTKTQYKEAYPSKNNKELAKMLVSNKIAETRSNLGELYLKECLGREFTNMLKKKKLAEEGHEAYYLINKKKINSIVSKRIKSQKLGFLRFAKEKEIDEESLSNKKYVYYPDLKEREGEKTLNPYRIGREFLGDLIATAEGRGDTKRQKELLEVAKKIINGKVVSVRDVKTVLSKPGKILFSQVKASLEQKNLAGELQDTQQFRVFDYDEIRKNGLDLSLLSEEFGDSLKQSGLYFACRDLIASELIRSLEEAEGRNGGSNKILSTFWKRYSPLEYDLVAAKKSKKIKYFFEEYKFEVTKDVDTLLEAVRRAHSCLTEGRLRCFEKDIGTRFLVGYCKNKPVGYSRIFIGETPANESVFAIDTIEADARKSGEQAKNFERNLDWMRAMGLASVQFALDANAKYVFCSDNRVCYGLKQAFGNKYFENAKFKKLGEWAFDLIGGYRYTFGFDNFTGNWEGKTSVLLVNWRRR